MSFARSLRALHTCKPPPPPCRAVPVPEHRARRGGRHKPRTRAAQAAGAMPGRSAHHIFISQVGNIDWRDASARGAVALARQGGGGGGGGGGG